MSTLIPRYTEKAAEPYMPLIQHIHVKYMSTSSCAYITHPNSLLQADTYPFANLPSSPVCSSPQRLKSLDPTIANYCPCPASGLDCSFFTLDLHLIYSISYDAKGSQTTLEVLRTRLSNNTLVYFFYNKVDRTILFEFTSNLELTSLKEADSEALSLFVSVINDLRMLDSIGLLDANIPSDDIFKSMENFLNEKNSTSPLIPILLNKGI